MQDRETGLKLEQLLSESLPYHIVGAASPSQSLAHLASPSSECALVLLDSSTSAGCGAPSGRDISLSMSYDAIVVGSGITGGFAAKELTERGLETLVLEAWRSIAPEHDYDS